MEFHGTKPLQYEKLTIDIFSENIGKYLIKKYALSTEKIKTADIIAACIEIVVDDKTDNSIQQSKNFLPKITTTKNVKAIHSEIANEINKANDLFRINGYNFLEKLLQIAANEEDQIDHKIRETRVSKRCICLNEKCSKLFYCLK